MNAPNSTDPDDEDLRQLWTRAAPTARPDDAFTDRVLLALPPQRLSRRALVTTLSNVLAAAALLAAALPHVGTWLTFDPWLQIAPLVRWEILGAAALSLGAWWIAEHDWLDRWI